MYSGALVSECMLALARVLGFLSQFFHKGKKGLQWDMDSGVCFPAMTTVCSLCHTWSEEGASSMMALGRGKDLKATGNMQREKAMETGVWRGPSLSLAFYCPTFGEELTFCPSTLGKSLSTGSRVRWGEEHCGAAIRPCESWPGPGDSHCVYSWLCNLWAFSKTILPSCL